MDPLEDELARLGARAAPQWLAACVNFLQGARPGFGGAPLSAQAKAVLQQLLAADLNQCGAPSLPPGVQGLHDTTLPGKLLLQVDEVFNIGAAVRERYSGNDGGQRCLKLLLTDGVQQVAAVEYRHTPALHSAMPAGCKLVVQGAAVRRGMLLLTPQCCAVLGGGVPRLEDARRRMVAHWTQPAVGRRGPPPTMAQATAEATRAALLQQQQQEQQQQQQQQPQRRRPEVGQQLMAQRQQQDCAPQRISGGAAAGAAAPLHDHNGGAGPSGGAKRSRLALSKAPTQAAADPAPADFGFAEPPQQQPGTRPNGPVRVQPAAPNQLAQRLRQATGGAAAGGAAAAAAAACGMQGAGTDDDPICLDGAEEEQQGQPNSSDAAAAEGDVAMAAADDGDEGWADEAAAPDGAHLDPWEQGYEAAEDEEQLPDADQLDGAGWQDGDGWQAADDWQDGEDGGEEAMEEDAAADDCEQQGQVDAAAEAAAPAEDDDGCWGDKEDAAEGAAPCPAVPAAAARQPAPAQAAAGARLAGKRRSSGSAVEVPRAVSQRQRQQQQQQQQQQQLDGLDGGSQPMRHAKPLQRSPKQPAQQPRKAQAAAATPVGEASTISSTLGLADLTVQPPCDRSHQAPRVPTAVAAAPQQPARQPQRQQQQQQAQQQASPSVLGALAVPELEALSPSLLGAAPTLAEVMYSKPATAVLEAAAPAAAAVAVGGDARACGSSGRTVPRVPALRGAPQRPGPASGRGLRLLSVSAPAAAAARPAATPKPRAMEAAAPAPVAPAVSDDDMPSFALLDDLSPARPQLGAAPAAAASQDEPFTYLLQLQRRATSAGPASFPLSARIFGTIRGITGKLGFTNPLTGQPEYTMDLEVEDGSLLVPARLGAQFMREFFDVEPQEFQALLADPDRKLEGVELAKGLQQLLSSYSGLIEVELAGPGQPLLVRNIGQEMREDEVAALQRRAGGG
ncbi:hypothetical protein COHA_004170 [Chlorella ohadii]|uniref:RecQ-mediated genome instability protein 1 n=1 Tax=Chlorella ohadii TaxID=2649997 RepID=A0AAD5DTT2_9CHLO|nr:hypothetical protein COHA_004170 [Chlorella ohadii]